MVPGTVVGTPLVPLKLQALSSVLPPPPPCLDQNSSRTFCSSALACRRRRSKLFSTLLHASAAFGGDGAEQGREVFVPQLLLAWKRLRTAVVEHSVPYNWVGRLRGRFVDAGSHVDW